VDSHLECRHPVLGGLKVVSGGHLWLQHAERARSEAECERPVGSGMAVVGFGGRVTIAVFAIGNELNKWVYYHFDALL
jgi:hypothetical protein